IAGLSSYQPPTAAYVLALTGWTGQHRFYHGERPQTPGSIEPEDRAAGGIEIYYRSHSFLMTAGGMFLNSGYGHDEISGYKQCAVAQSTTLLPAKAQVTFGHLPRFDRWPSERDAN